MRRLIGQGLRVLLSLVLATSVSLTTTPVAQASCNPGRSANSTYYWMGTNKSLTGITGVQSTIRTYDPYMSNSGGFSYAWVMLVGNTTHQYMQIGPYESAAGRSTTVQINNDWANPIQWDFAATSVGSYHTYQVLLGSPGSLAAKIDTDIKISYSLGITPKHGQIFAEIVNRANQMMGDSSTKEYFNVNQVRNASRNWVNISTSNPISPPTSYFGSSGNGYSFYVWDKCQ